MSAFAVISPDVATFVEATGTFATTLQLPAMRAVNMPAESTVPHAVAGASAPRLPSIAFAVATVPVLVADADETLQVTFWPVAISTPFWSYTLAVNCCLPFITTLTGVGETTTVVETGVR